MLDGRGGRDTVTFSVLEADRVLFSSVKVDLVKGSAVLSTLGLPSPGRTSLTSIENVIGTEAGDVIWGDSHANTLSGGINFNGTGRDVIHGRGGNDRISGNDSADTLYGGAGDDRINGGTGHNTIDGGPGLDLCVNPATGPHTSNCELAIPVT